VPTFTRSLSFACDRGQDQNGGEFNCRAKGFELCRKMQHYSNVYSMDAKICSTSIVWILQRGAVFIHEVRSFQSFRIVFQTRPARYS